VVADDHLFVLSERHRYLKARMLAKDSVGRDTRYDERERAALEWALGVLRIFQREAREQSQAILQGDDFA
jgi:hypothetical protein